MPELDDQELLAEFARTESETAFATLVARHVNLVYSAAWRFTGNAHHAEEITQAVFIILARKAGSLQRGTVLSGWLYQTARFTAANFVKGEIRRQTREQEVYMQSTLNTPDAAAWEQVAPLLDEAMGQLGKIDRDAVVLRYFENKTAAEAAAKLKLTEAAAHKRTNRALEKLRKFFTKRGVALSAAAVAGVVSANSVQAAPAGLAKTVCAAAAVKGAAAGGSTLALVKGALKFMAWAKAKTAVAAGVGILLMAGTTTVVVLNVTRPAREARNILGDVIQKYASLTSYSSTGKTIENVDGRLLTASFSMQLGRPNRYRVEYEQHALTFTNKGAAWSDGTGDYFANDVVHQTTALPIRGPAHSLTMIADISGEATAVVPAMFYGVQIPENSEKNPWMRLVESVRGKMTHLVEKADEKVGETDCRVLTAETKDGTTRLWIGKDDFLVHQSQQSVKAHLPDATDSEIANLLAGSPGQPPMSVSEMKARINKGQREASATMKPVTVVFSDNNGTSGLKSMTIQPPGITVYTQTYENISVNQQFSAADFTRQPTAK
jgi:RNA polymerase sigma factor (sigma-70 family)